MTNSKQHIGKPGRRIVARYLGKLIPGILFLLLIAGVGGCSSSECYDNHSALPLAEFYSTETFGKVSVNRLEVYGIGAPGDSVLYYDETLSQAYLPFRLGNDTTRYVFAYLSFLQNGDNVSQDVDLGPRDTITFIYTPKPWFVSPSCGAMYFFEMEKVEHTSFLIDSIYTDPTITNVNAANIKIFFKSSADE